MIRKVACTAAAAIIIAVIAWAAADSIAPDPEPERRVEVRDLVINTPEDGDRALVTVMDDEEVVCQYDGELELWKGADGKCYAIIHVDQGQNKRRESGDGETNSKK